MSRADHRKHDAQLEKMRKQEEVDKKADYRPRVRDQIIVGLGFFAEYKAVRGGSAVLAWLSAALFSLAFCDYISGVIRSRFRREAQVLGTVILLTLTFFLVSHPKTLNWSAWSNNGDYLPGTVIGGIKWRPDFSELRMVIENPTSEDYTDLDITITPDIAIAEAGQVSSLPGVSFLNGAEGSDFYGSGKDPKTGKPFQQRFAGPISSSNRVLCSKLPHNAVLHMVFATTTLDAILGKTKSRATQLHAVGEYKVAGETVTIDKTVYVNP